MKMVGVKTEMKKITTEDETATEDSKVGDVNYKTISNVKKYEDYLSLTIDLPLIFGFSLIEKEDNLNGMILLQRDCKQC